MTTGTRNITTTTAAAAAASNFHPVLFLKLEFDDGNVNLHSELGDITFAGDTYTGVGKLGQVSAASEPSDLSLAQMTFTLSGLPGDLAAIVLEEQYQGRLATLYIGYLDLTTHVLVDTPTILYKGLMDTADISQDKTFSISLSVGNRFAAWDKPVIRRYNNATQQTRFPGDTGLQYIEQTTNKTIIWGAGTVKKEGWEALLYHHILEAKGKPFQWGSHDCILWCAEWVHKVTGIDHAAQWRCTYSTEQEATDILLAHGFDSPTAFVAMYLPETKVAKAQRGDIMFHPQGMLGICDGAFTYFLTYDRVLRHPFTSCTKAWKVQ